MKLHLVMRPLLYPYVFATIRLMFGVAWKVTLAAELFGGNSGLGYVINLARKDYDTTSIFVILFLIIFFVYCAERFFFKPIQRSEGSSVGKDCVRPYRSRWWPN